MKKFVVILFAVCLVASAFAFAGDKGMKTASYTGYITDAKCGANGAAAGKEACAKKCIDGGEKAVFVNDKDKSVWAIDNQDAVKGHEGHHVTVKGHPGKDSIHIESVSMVEAGK
jgi:hypothetical protein